MASLSISELLTAISADPTVFQGVSFDTTVRFFDLVSLLKPVLKLECSIHDPEPLNELPDHVLKFLESCLGANKETLSGLWTMFRAEVWKVEYGAKLTQQLGNKYIGLFLSHGPANGISGCCRCTLTAEIDKGLSRSILQHSPTD
jgi:hypothetical protein